VALNPLSSEAALKEREQLSLTTKEREKLANQSPVVKSLFDCKGNSKFKNDESLVVDKKVPVFG
jgi:hypothetical protein